jgi:hypothetical protein
MGKLSMVVHTYNPSMQKAEAGRAQVQGLAGLEHSETLPQKMGGEKGQGHRKGG